MIMICAAPYGAAHTFYMPEPAKADTSRIELHEISVSASPVSTKISSLTPEGVSLGSQALRNLPSFLGQNDPIRIMQALPAVASNDVISGGIYVQGCENAHNLVTIDGAQVYNPSHLFGLFSVFNTPHFSDFRIRTDSHKAIDGNYIGALIQGNTSDIVPYHATVEANVGIIGSNATVRIPVKQERDALTVSGRITYINALFGDALKLDNAPIRYGFNDWNLTYLHKCGKGRNIKISAFLSSDDMDLPDPNYASQFKFGWKNIALSASLADSCGGRHTLGFSTYSNRFDISYSDIKRELPSGLKDYSYVSTWRSGKFDFAASAHIRDIKPQLPASHAGHKSTIATEAYVASDFHIRILPKWEVKPGIKFTGYATKSFRKVYPLPSLTTSLDIKEWLRVTLCASKLAQYTHKIEESTMGLPTDYIIAADNRFRPVTANCLVAGASGSALGGDVSYSISGYYRDIRHMTDWCGIMLNMLSDSYDPSSDIVTGKGRAWGISAMANIRFGALQGWVSYNYGKSRMMTYDNDYSWHPTSHDRTHDMNIMLSWHATQAFKASASWVYATGHPYTKPLYGYILGENIICEFEPLNSSRLPAMHRLDLSIDWTFWQRGRARQGLCVAVYNAYGAHNTLFQTFSYSPNKGFYKKSMVFKAIIPSVSYYLKF